MNKTVTTAQAILGLVLTIASMLVLGAGAWATRESDIAALKSDRDQLKRDLGAVKWIVFKLAQKQGIDTSEIEKL